MGNLGGTGGCNDCEQGNGMYNDTNGNAITIPSLDKIFLCIIAAQALIIIFCLIACIRRNRLKSKSKLKLVPQDESDIEQDPEIEKDPEIEQGKNEEEIDELLNV